MARVEPAVVIGLGQMGSVFATGFLRAGRPVHPVVRGSSLASVGRELPSPAIVLVAVGEDDLDAVLGSLPEGWRDRVGLLQNELLPREWERHGLVEPTVIAVWFEKKNDRGVRVILPSPVHGPRAKLLSDALGRVDVPVRRVDARDAMVLELVLKNLYILTANIAGLETRGTVGELWERHRARAVEVAGEILAIQQRLAARPLPAESLLNRLGEAFEADPEHSAVGRTAAARLDRAIEHAHRAGLDVPVLRGIRSATGA